MRVSVRLRLPLAAGRPGVRQNPKRAGGIVTAGGTYTLKLPKMGRIARRNICGNRPSDLLTNLIQFKDVSNRRPNEVLPKFLQNPLHYCAQNRDSAVRPSNRALCATRKCAVVCFHETESRKQTPKGVSTCGLRFIYYSVPEMISECNARIFRSLISALSPAS